MNIIIHLNGNAHTVTLADTKAACKGDFVFKLILFYGFLQKLNDFGRALKITRAAYANLNDYKTYTFALISFWKNSSTVSAFTE